MLLVNVKIYLFVQNCNTLQNFKVRHHEWVIGERICFKRQLIFIYWSRNTEAAENEKNTENKLLNICKNL